MVRNTDLKRKVKDFQEFTLNFTGKASYEIKMKMQAFE